MFYNTFGVGYPEFRQGLQYLDGALMKGMYEVDVTVPAGLDMIYAVTDGKVRQITGDTRIYATNDEINYFKSRGITINKAYTCLVFSNEGSPFKDYIGSFFKMKNEFGKKDPRRQIAKLFLNSLYGIFGIKGQATNLVSFYTNKLNESQRNLVLKYVLPNGFKHKVEMIGRVALENLISLVRNRQIPEDSVTVLNRPQSEYRLNAYISAAVTAIARINLMKGMEGVTRMGCKVYYFDTDSLIYGVPHEAVNTTTKDLVPYEYMDGALGSWEDENPGKEIVSFTACATKCYSYLLDNKDGTVTSKVTFKGFSSEPTTLPVKDIESDLKTPSSKPSYNAIANFVLGNNCSITETREGLKKSKLDLKVVSSTVKKSVKNFRTNRMFESINISKPNTNTEEKHPKPSHDYSLEMISTAAREYPFCPRHS